MSGVNDAEVLLLTLEVEAAAARNADLSLRVQELQSMLLQSSHTSHTSREPQLDGQEVKPSTQAAVEGIEVPAQVPQTARGRDTEASPPVGHQSTSRGANMSEEDAIIMAKVNLDDALFELAEIMTLLYPRESDRHGVGESLSERRRSLMEADMNLAELTHTFLTEVKRVKMACEARLTSLHERIRVLDAGKDQAGRPLP